MAIPDPSEPPYSIAELKLLRRLERLIRGYGVVQPNRLAWQWGMIKAVLTGIDEVRAKQAARKAHKPEGYGEAGTTLLSRLQGLDKEDS